ncbi:MAG: dihydromonapterin reductase [Thiotrichales bacterium]|nr:dihydromonapterin reductase [Thiotrichales bacterium]
MLQNAIFITGAGQRIGLFLAKQVLLHTDYPVVFTYRSEKPGVAELIALGAIGFQVDFNQVNAEQTLITQLQQTVASLRAVVHNASTWASDEDVANDFTLYDSMFKTHVELPYRLNVALKPLLDASDSALKDIVAITDTSVDLVNDQHIAYLASKTALNNLTKNFAKKYAPEIKVNAIAPGLILFNEGDTSEYKQKRLTQSAIPIEPGAIVIWQALEYLLNSSYTTGISLPVDGGKNLI